MLTEILFACTVRFKGKNSKLIGQKLKGSNGKLIRILPQLKPYSQKSRIKDRMLNIGKIG